jgi:saccharopine dehydrogenase (NADP+, L-glutamate forming)
VVCGDAGTDTYHVRAAKFAIAHGRHFATTSYVSDAMRGLHESAVAAGVTVVNECGVDPGTDHMSAMRLIDRIHSESGKVLSFTSYCGGLPSAAANNNPMGYKLSWAPRGVLLASKNSARFLEDGETKEVEGKVLFTAPETHTMPGYGNVEGYPNRDSTIYRGAYRRRLFFPFLSFVLVPMSLPLSAHVWCGDG